MAALSRFISRLGKKGLPLFRLLKAQEKFIWSKDADKAFIEFKRFLTTPSIMTAPPQKDETLLIYITTTNRVVSTAIVVEREEARHAYKVQRPV